MGKRSVEKFSDMLFSRFPELRPSEAEFHKAYCILENTFVKRGALFVCGNGGSCSDAEHIVGELSKGFLKKREPSEDLKTAMNERIGENINEVTSRLQMGFRAMVLSTHQALSTAFANDVDPLLCCAQQLFVMGTEGDSVIGISTSGNAENILNVFKTAGGLGINRILLTGEGSGKCVKYADCVIHAPAKETYRVQEYHLPIYHTLCMMLEERFFGQDE